VERPHEGHAIGCQAKGAQQAGRSDLRGDLRSAPVFDFDDFAVAEATCELWRRALDGFRDESAGQRFIGRKRKVVRRVACQIERRNIRRGRQEHMCARERFSSGISRRLRRFWGGHDGKKTRDARHHEDGHESQSPLQLPHAAEESKTRAKPEFC
jgi:hypothetical protein